MVSYEQYPYTEILKFLAPIKNRALNWECACNDVICQLHKAYKYGKISHSSYTRRCRIIRKTESMALGFIVGVNDLKSLQLFGKVVGE